MNTKLFPISHPVACLSINFDKFYFFTSFRDSKVRRLPLQFLALAVCAQEWSCPRWCFKLCNSEEIT